MEKCGLTEKSIGIYVDSIAADAYVWYEKGWRHDDYNHTHRRYQLTYVEEGYQYFHIENNIYLVPKNHVIWIPSEKEHRTASEAETVNLMLVLFRSVPNDVFYKGVHIFAAPPVLKEMLLYASKWNRLTYINEEQALFLKAMLHGLQHFCSEQVSLQVPVPSDNRLIPVCNKINTAYQHHLNIHELADTAGMSVRSLQRTFKQETGITVQKYLQLIRILKSVELIDTARYTLSEIAFMVGYRSLSAFSVSYASIMKEKPRLRK